MKIASIEIDPQRTFTPLCPSELAVEGGDLIVDELNEQAKLANLRVFSKDAHASNADWVVDTHEEMLQPLDFENADLTWVKHAELGTEGFLLLPGLPKPSDYDFFVYKGLEGDMHPYGACYHDLADTISTGLIEWLVFNDVSTVIVGGLAQDYCLLKSVLQLLASNRFTVIVNLAATRPVNESNIESSNMQMMKAGALLFKDAAEINKYLNK